MLRPSFTTRQEYETALIHITNGIFQERPRSPQRLRREQILNAIAAEMRERFPILTYDVEIEHEDGNFRPTMNIKMDLQTAEIKLAQMQNRLPQAKLRITQKGTR